MRLRTHQLRTEGGCKGEKKKEKQREEHQGKSQGDKEMHENKDPVNSEPEADKGEREGQAHTEMQTHGWRPQHLSPE